MALRSGLRVYLYAGFPLYNPLLIREVTDEIQAVQISTVAPGGWGEFSALLKLTNSRFYRPELSLFARIAVTAAKQLVWLGELTQPAQGLSDQDGEYLKISGLGMGNGLRDDPTISAYTNQTVQQIALAQFQLRWNVSHHEWLFSTDTSQLFPDNPVATYSPAYDGKTFEEVLSHLALLAGDYNWGVEPDPLQTDLAGFPMARIFARKRDTTTTAYTAYVKAGDIAAYEFTPDAAHAYNHIEIDYTNGSGGLGKARVFDPRLNASDLSQGTAPFRYRKYLRDFSGDSTINSAQATSIANTYLAEFENPSYTGSVTLANVRDAQSNPLVEMALCQAGGNIYLPEEAILSTQLPTTATANTNLFYITEAKYTEVALSGGGGSGGAGGAGGGKNTQQLALTLGYARDDAEIRLARLQLAADASARGGKIVNSIQALGAPEGGYVSWQFSNGVSGQATGAAAAFMATCSQAPTSLTLTQLAINNLNSITSNAFTVYGANVFGAVIANGSGYYQATFATVGNCLLAVDDADTNAGRFAWHCDGCDTAHRDLALRDHLRVNTVFGSEPGRSALAITCPKCGLVEAFNTALAERDEQELLDGKMHYPHRAQQARLIRAAMAHPHIALARR